MDSPTKTSNTPTPLGERDANAPVSPQKLNAKATMKTKLADTSKPAPGFPKLGDNNPGTYISPSDAIMSPASQKLAAMKGRRLAGAKPKSLFAKTVSSQHISSASKLKEQDNQDQTKDSTQ